MKRILTLIAALAALTALAQFTTGLTTTVRITGTPTRDDRAWLSLIVTNHNDRVAATNGPLLVATNTATLKDAGEQALSNIVANAVQSYREQAAARVDQRLTRDQWLLLKASLEERLAAGESVETILTDVER